MALWSTRELPCQIPKTLMNFGRKKPWNFHRVKRFVPLRRNPGTKNNGLQLRCIPGSQPPFKIKDGGPFWMILLEKRMVWKPTHKKCWLHFQGIVCIDIYLY